MFVVSSSHADPMEEFSRLTQQQHSQQHQQPHKLPKWFSPNVLRYYVLVHDVTEQAEAKYVSLLFTRERPIWGVGPMSDLPILRCRRRGDVGCCRPSV